MIQNSKQMAAVVAILVVIAFCTGYLWGDGSTRCAETRGGRTCVEVKPGGDNELIFYPDKVVRD